ncbi:hypothetical protein D9M68_449640 [compost metagenome]
MHRHGACRAAFLQKCGQRQRQGAENRQAIGPERNFAEIERPAGGDEHTGQADEGAEPLAGVERLAENGPGEDRDRQRQHVGDQRHEAGRHAVGDGERKAGEIAGHGECAEEHLRRRILQPDFRPDRQREGQQQQAGDEAAPEQDQEDRRMVDGKSDADEAGAPGDHQRRLEQDQNDDRGEPVCLALGQRSNVAHLKASGFSGCGAPRRSRHRIAQAWRGDAAPAPAR